LLPIDDANIRQPKTKSQVFFSRNIFLDYVLKKYLLGSQEQAHTQAYARITQAHTYASKGASICNKKNPNASWQTKRFELS